VFFNKGSIVFEESKHIGYSYKGHEYRAKEDSINKGLDIGLISFEIEEHYTY
jgi:hypothetical protein